MAGKERKGKEEEGLKEPASQLLHEDNRIAFRLYTEASDYSQRGLGISAILFTGSSNLTEQTHQLHQLRSVLSFIN